MLSDSLSNKNEIFYHLANMKEEASLVLDMFVNCALQEEHNSRAKLCRRANWVLTVTGGRTPGEPSNISQEGGGSGSWVCESDEG